MAIGRKGLRKWRKGFGGEGAPGTISGTVPVTGFGGGDISSALGTRWTQSEGIAKPGEFREGWYDPMHEASVMAPLRQVMGMGYGGTGGEFIDPSRGQFGEAGAMFQQAGLPQEAIQSALGQMGGFQAPGELAGQAYLPKSFAGNLEQMGHTLSEAQSSYDSTLEDLKRAEELAGERQKEEMLGHRVERQKMQSGKLPGYEKARAAQAKTGMAYSAPAAEELGGLREENIQSLSDIKRAEAGTKKAYQTTMEDIGIEEESALGELESEKELTGIKLRSQLGGAAREFADIKSEGLGIMEAWRGNPYAVSNKKSLVGARPGGEGEGLFQETEVEELNWLDELVSESEAFSTQLSDTLTESLGIAGGAV